MSNCPLHIYEVTDTHASLFDFDPLASFQVGDILQVLFNGSAYDVRVVRRRETIGDDLKPRIDLDLEPLTPPAAPSPASAR